MRETATQVARPIFFATLIIIAAYLPLFALQRVEAKLFYPMAYAVGFAQFGALAFTLLLIPGIAYYRLSQAAARVSQSGPGCGSECDIAGPATRRLTVRESPMCWCLCAAVAVV